MLKKLTYGKTYAAVEHTSNENGDGLFNVLVLKKKKKELALKEKKQCVQFDEVICLLEPQKHVFLIVNNLQVLTKSISKDSNDSLDTIRRTFPNITLNDFYYEIISNDHTSFVVIVRKKYIDDLINDYKEKGISVVGFSLGNLAVENLIPFINVDELSTSNSKIGFENKEVKNIQKEFSPLLNYEVNDLEVTNNDILPLSGVIAYFSENKYSSGLKDKAYSLKKDFQQSKLFSIGLYSALVLLFTVLLINFLIFGYYHSRVNQLSSEVQTLNAYKNQLLMLEEQAIQKEKLVSSLQVTENSKTSFFIDEIAQNIPKTILLSGLQFQPLKGRIKKGRPIQFYQDEIIIRGVANSNDEFTGFISDLEKKKWVRRVLIVNYGKNKEAVNSFEILIKL